MNINYQITPNQRTDIRTALISAKVVLEHVSHRADLAYLKDIIDEKIREINLALEATKLETLWRNEGEYDVKRQSERRAVERKAYEATRS